MGAPTITAAPALFRGCSLRQAAGQSIPNATYTELSWDSAEYDTDSFADTVNNRIVIPAGVEKIRLTIGYRLGGTSGFSIVNVWKNGVRYTPFYYQCANSSGVGPVIVSDVIEVSEGDYFEVQIYHNTGAAKTTAEAFYGCEVVK
tara:strand:+ start:11068 stop:11502 length:435 start_codon:yes stop_codon:yes gene_type:complete